MPKRVGYLYDKMVDRDFIRAVIQEAAKGRRSRKDIAPVLADLDGYVEKTYELVASESFVPSEPKIREIYDESSEKHRKIKMVPFWPDGVIQWMLVTAMKIALSERNICIVDIAPAVIFFSVRGIIFFE